MDIENLIKNGLFYSHHAKEKLQSEKISEEDVKETLLKGEPQADSSTSNYRVHAWNRKQHYSIFHEALNLSVVCCESLEHGILVCSVFHGKSHDLSSNPYQKHG